MIPKNLELEKPPVQIFSILFPRLTREEALLFILKTLKEKISTCICFPDMSTLNLAAADSSIQKLIENFFIPFNDGAALEFTAWLKGLPFPDNLNGTDFAPKLLGRLPASTKVFLVGSKNDVAEKTLESFKHLYSEVSFIGACQGFLSDEEEKALIQRLETQKPDIILVGMGNPLQLEWIQKHQKNPKLSSTIWLAVGGLFDFYGGTRRRAPEWVRQARLEWLYIVFDQPYKFLRYFLGIPRFFYYLITKF